MIEKKLLVPPSGSKDIIELAFLEDSGIINLPLMSFSFNKDYDSPTGEGELVFGHTPQVNKLLKRHALILIKIGWEFPDGKREVKEYMSGYIDEVHIRRDEIRCTIKDKGILLEEEGDVSYTDKKRSFIMADIIKKAGLVPQINFTGVEDDTLSYTSQRDSGGGSGDGVTGAGKPSCAYNCGSYSNWYTTTVANKCPECGKTGTIAWVQGKDYHWCAREDNPGYEGMYVCCQKLGGCDTDWCICGKNHSRAAKYGGYKDIQVISGMKVTSGPITLAKGSSTPVEGTSVGTDTAEGLDNTEYASSSSGGSYWDMLIELSDQANKDLEVFCWMDNVYVRKVPDQKTANLFLNGHENLIADSMNMKEGDPSIANTIIVNYGNSKNPSVVKVQEKRLVDKYGEEIVEKYDQYKMNETEARSFALKELNKKQRDAEFSLDCTVIGSPEWFVCRWVKVWSEGYDLDDEYYITRINTSLDANSALSCDLSLAEYPPTINVTDETSFQGNIGSLAGIMTAAAKFRYCKGVSTAAGMVSAGCGDCWAMSEFIYSKLTLAGIRARVLQYPTSEASNHRSVQYFDNGNWIDVPYKQYGVANLFRATSNKPNAFVYMGG